jgi:hypothetical protein
MKKLKNEILFVCIIRLMLRLNFLMTLCSTPQWYTFSTCPARSVGLREPPPVRELPMLCRLIKREQSHWERPPMTHNFGMVYKKINYRLNRSKIDNVRVSKES